MRVSIIIPTHNRPEYLEKCLNSLEKTYIKKDTLIYIIDDCSSDLKTIDLIKDFQKEGCIIKKVFKKQNSGIYDSLLTSYDYSFNNGYEYVILLGSDSIVNNYFYDVMVYYRLLFPNNIISGFNTLTLSENGTPRHPVINNFGFYVEKKTNGSLCNGIDKNIYETYYKQTLIDLIKKKKFAYDTISSKKASDAGFNVVCTVPSVSEHIGLKSTLKHDFNPDISVDFREYVELWKNKETKNIITVNLATYPKREKEFEKNIKNLLSIKIIDKIRVYLNEYDTVPEYLINERIGYIIDKENLKDSGKFYWASSYKDEYYFTIDDDLLINENYILKHIELLNKYNNKIFVSLHGKILNKNPENFRDTIAYYHCLKKVEDDSWINLIGTGVMVFDNSKYKFYNELFLYHGMADLWISLYCQKNLIPCLARKHDSNEIELIYNGKDTLWNKQWDFVSQHKEILNSIKNWKIFKM